MRKLKNEELKRISVEEFKKEVKIPLILILDNVRSLNNVGAAFRTSDAFLVEKIHLTGITGTPPHREIQKTALGSTESVDWEYEKDILTVLKKLKNNGWKIISIEQADKSIKLQDFYPDNKNKYALVFGNEIKGVDEEVFELSDHVIEIPQFGTKHSLNISVSIGIVIWDLYTKLFSKVKSDRS